MGYINSDYYQSDYKGADAGEDLEKYIERASDIIDQVTLYKLAKKPFESQPEFIQRQVKKAVAAQVEFYVMQGGDEAVNAGVQDAGAVRIGSFQFNSTNSAGRVSPSALSCLEPTGLLYRGLDVIDNGNY